MKHIRNNQRGIVSILVTMIMMIVITLIVLGFTQVARRNQREALDSQLGTQAYYAAESGVNAAQTYINGLLQANQSINQVTDCKGALGLTVPTSLSTGVAYTCVMINPGPGSLLVNDVSQTTATVLHAQNGTGSVFKYLTFKWTPDPGASGNCATPGLGQYPNLGSWGCNYGILRVDILKATGLPNYSATNLANATSSLFLQPSSANTSPAPAVSFNTNTKAYRYSCLPAGGSCSVTIDVSGANAADYYLRLSTIYLNAPSVEVTGVNSDNTAASFANGQVVIDSTGRAQDQIKRIQVRVPFSQAGSAPAFAVVSSGEICKDLSISSVSSSWSAGQCGADETGWPNVNGTKY